MPLSKPYSALLSPWICYRSPAAIPLPIRNPQRHYATHTDEHKSQSHDIHHDHSSTADGADGGELPWPTKDIDYITPYDVFNMNQNDVYSKHTFHRLVKMYHPDRPISCCANALSKTERLDRFRMVMAAHDILCDPAKKRAYDVYGVGWLGSPGDNMRKSKDYASYNGSYGRSSTANNRHKRHHTTSTQSGGFAGWAWKYSHKNTNFDWDSPERNATWEDWEKWYHRNDPKPESAITKNINFITLVAIFSFVGILTQLSRFEAHQASLTEDREKRHGSLSRELSKMERDMQMYDSRNERIQAFLHTRDPYGHAPLLAEERKRLEQPKDH